MYSSDEDQDEAFLIECFHHMNDCICTEKTPTEGTYTRCYFKDMNALYMYEEFCSYMKKKQYLKNEWEIKLYLIFVNIQFDEW